MKEDVIGSVMDQKDIPAYVRFERRPVQDMTVTDRYAAKDVDYAIITPPYSKDEMIKKAATWLAEIETHARTGRMPPERVDAYKRSYAAWKEGNELPVDGTPIKGWPVISPAQQETLIRMKVMTVEVLAAMNDEGVKRYGMGAQDLVNKARAWISQANDKAPLTMENARLKKQVEVLTESLDSLSAKVQAMASQVVVQAPAVEQKHDIQIDDLIEPEPKKKKGA